MSAVMVLETEVIPSSYHDSVVLMRVSAQVRKEPGVREVALFMGTPANHALLEQAGLATPQGTQAGPNDLIVTVKADSRMVFNVQTGDIRRVYDRQQ